ncbi:MAG: arginase [Thermoflexales bacterium]|nr:arginase [Thermoflexales bacterium]
MPQAIHIVGAPIGLGAGKQGVDLGPNALRYARLAEQLAGLENPILDKGNVPLASISDPGPEPRLRCLPTIAAFCATLAEWVADSVAAGALPLVLGGDHSLSIGSVAGTARGRELGLLWLDAHGDFNTALTSPSGNIHGMSLACLTGQGHPDLIGLAGRVPAIQPRHVALVGIRDLDPPERDALKASGLHCYTMQDIDRRGMAAVMDDALAVVGAARDGFHASFDLDVLDPREAPGVGTPVPGGISYREAHLAMEFISVTGKLRSLDLVEDNPILDDRNQTAMLGVQLILSAFGKQIL